VQTQDFHHETSNETSDPKNLCIRVACFVVKISIYLAVKHLMKHLENFLQSFEPKISLFFTAKHLTKHSKSFMPKISDIYPMKHPSKHSECSIKFFKLNISKCFSAGLEHS